MYIYLQNNREIHILILFMLVCVFKTNGFSLVARIALKKVF